MLRLSPRTATGATFWYVALTLALTWPLAARLTTGVPSDLGDPLLNDWILSWNARTFLRALGGDLGALSAWPHTNIFHPAPYTLGYSELLVTQTLLILPLYALTHHAILCYNVLFLAVFVLSGLGMYLFVRALTGDWRAAFLAGAAFAFAPYRFHQAPHIQVMWSPWMPFVLYGLRRWLDKTGQEGSREGGQAGRPTWVILAWTAVALAAQNLSCGYYMLFFAPFVALYAVWEMAARRRGLDVRAWIALALTGAGSLALTAPFMSPYFALRRLGQRPRGLEEVASFSADTFAYFTAHAGQHLWGWLQAYPRAEGSLFPGALPIVLTIVALAAAVRAAVRAGSRTSDADGASPGQSRALRVAIVVLSIVAGLYFVIFVGLFFGLEGKHVFGPLEVRLFSVMRPLAMTLGASAIVLVLSPIARVRARSLLQSPAVFLAVAAFLAFWLSLGPIPRVMGDTLRDASIYTAFYHYVPGFSGLRVPARFAMIVVLFLSAGVGVGYAAMAASASRARWLFPLLLAGVVAEGFVAPLGMNGPAVTVTHLEPSTDVPTSPTPVTRAIDALPQDAVLLELPFGDISWEIQYLYLSTFHWRRMVNGYSGDVPAHYVRTRDALALLPEEGGDRAWQTLRQSGATHAIVHEAAYGPSRAAAMRAWLEVRGARLVRQAGEATIYTLR